MFHYKHFVFLLQRCRHCKLALQCQQTMKRCGCFVFTAKSKPVPALGDTVEDIEHSDKEEEKAKGPKYTNLLMRGVLHRYATSAAPARI